MPILPLSSVDNHKCIDKPNIKTTPNQPCSDDIILQNTSCEAISPPCAIQNYDKEHITFYLCNINSASYAAKNHLFNNCIKHHVWSVLETRCATDKQLQHFKQDLLTTNEHAAAI